jgi:3'(2'), 5'-bisphosphate nucleotidase
LPLVDGHVDFSQARFCESWEPGHSDQHLHTKIADLLGLRGAPARLDSQCKYAVVARGEADIYLRLPVRPGYIEKIWDHAAGSLLVEEVGGRVTDANGRPLDFSRGRLLTENRGVVVAHAQAHAQVLAAVQKVMSSQVTSHQ